MWDLAAAAGHDRSQIRERIARRVIATSEFEAPAECPACGQSGWLIGWYVRDSEVYDGDEGQFEVLTVDAEDFACDHCGLVLPDEPYLAEAGLPTEFEIEREYEPEYDDYGND